VAARAGRSPGESGVAVIGLLRLVPKQQQVVWGGDLLHRRLEKPPADVPIGESWEVWEGDRIDVGREVGATLQQLADELPRELLGQIPLQRGTNRFPLLSKFIDAQQPLSVQVHPNDAQAQLLEGQTFGKTEAWYILEAQPEAWIIHGLTREVAARTFRERLEDGTADELLRKVPALPGETIFVPAGTVHAIGPGVLLHEVQETSDITYRLYDWNRQAEGTRRELHLDKGLQVSWLRPSPDPVIHPLNWREGDTRVSLILACEYFTAKRIEFPGRVGLDTDGRSFHIVTVVRGSCRLGSARERAEVSLGQSVILPACFGAYDLTSEHPATILVEYVSDVAADLVPELRTRGFEDGEIDRFVAQFAPLSHR